MMNSCQSNFEETSIKMDHQLLCYCFGPMIWQPHERPHWNWVVNMGNSSHDSNFSYGSDLAKPTRTVEDLESHFQVSTMNKKWLNSLKSSILSPGQPKPKLEGFVPSTRINPRFGHVLTGLLLSVVLATSAWFFTDRTMGEFFEEARCWRESKLTDPECSCGFPVQDMLISPYFLLSYE